ncbi:macrolide family glycosyltransferase [Actinopolyspora mortivallis]|nr:macrolide family glycosyltransferase [Actinopolyspora mortivallis]
MTVPAHGHVNPTLGLVSELVSRGHRVTYAINEDFAPLVEEAGANALCYESTFPPADDFGRGWPGPGEAEAAARKFYEEREAALPQVAAVYEGDLPDVVLYDIAAGHAPVLAGEWGVPQVQLSPTHVLYPDADAVDPGVKSEDGVVGDDVDPSSYPPRGRTPRRCLVTMPRSFQVDNGEPGDHYAFVGPMFSGRVVHGNWVPPDDRPVVLVSLGSVYNGSIDFFRTCVEAFRELDRHVVVALGRSFEEREFEGVPENVEIHEWVPQMRVLPWTSAFVTAGGMGSTMEALSHGVPLVVVPQAVDQFVTARRVVDLGLGTSLSSAALTPEALRAAVLHVSTDEHVAQRVRAIREEIAESGGARRAADIVETHG